MSVHIDRQILLTLLEGDEALLELLYDADLVPRDEESVLIQHAETVRVAHTLAHDLDVNWAGIEVILRMRTELVDTRRQLAALLELLRGATAPEPG